MRIPIIGVLYITLFFIEGCMTIGNFQSSNEFMPLSVGNKWVYGSHSSISSKWFYNYILEVVSIDTFNNGKYFKIRNSVFEKDSLKHYYYYTKVSNDTLFAAIYDEANKQMIDIILAVFSMSLHDSIQIGDRYNRRTITVENKSNNTIEFSYSTIDGPAQHRTYKRGVGLVNTFTRGRGLGDTELIDYKIN